MRVLVLHNRYVQRGGEDTVVDAEVAALRERGHDVRLVEVANGEPGSDASLAERARIARRAVWSRAWSERIARIAREFRPDVAHVHNHAYELSASIFPALARSGAAVVQTLHNFRMTCAGTYLLRDGAPCEDCVGSRASWHGVQHACFRGSRSGSVMLAGMQLAWRRGALANVARFVVLTEFARDVWLRAGVPAAQLVVRPNTVPDPGFSGGVDRAPDAPVLFVGRLEESKGVEVLDRAWGDEGCAGGRLVVAGTGPLAEALASRAGDGMRVVGAQSRAQVGALMAGARALVVPSTWYEGFPMVVLEAMAAGTPVIASDLGALREIVRSDADGGPDPIGWRVPPGDPAALRAAIEHVLASPAEAQRRGAAARTEYERRYAQPVVMDQLEAIYEAVLAGH